MSRRFLVGISVWGCLLTGCASQLATLHSQHDDSTQFDPFLSAEQAESRTQPAAAGDPIRTAEVQSTRQISPLVDADEAPGIVRFGVIEPPAADSTDGTSNAESMADGH